VNSAVESHGFPNYSASNWPKRVTAHLDGSDAVVANLYAAVITETTASIRALWPSQRDGLRDAAPGKSEHCCIRRSVLRAAHA
jgi:hypothetical protein